MLIHWKSRCHRKRRAKKARQAQKNISKSDKKKKRKRKESYAIYIYKVLKQVHPDTGISSKAMNIMNSFLLVFLKGLLLRPPGWLITTSGLPSWVVKYKLQCDRCLQFFSYGYRRPISQDKQRNLEAKRSSAYSSEVKMCFVLHPLSQIRLWCGNWLNIKKMLHFFFNEFNIRVEQHEFHSLNFNAFFLNLYYLSTSTNTKFKIKSNMN